jgi:hypothetical protein
MSEEFFNILASNNKDIDNQKLMDYISGKLSEEEKHEVEKTMADSEFINDAVEGLEKMPDSRKIQHYLEQLNKGLENHLEKKKLRREKRKLKEHFWIYFAIVFILLLCVIGYVVIRQYLK